MEEGARDHIERVWSRVRGSLIVPELLLSKQSSKREHFHGGLQDRDAIEIGHHRSKHVFPFFEGRDTI